MEYIRHYDSEIGKIIIAADSEGVTGLWFEGQKYFPDLSKGFSGEKPSAAAEKNLYSAVKWLSIYFSGKDPGFTPPLHLTGTDFQLDVWKLLLEIPYGSTVTYGELAARYAESKGKARMSAQAIGGAVGHNKVSLIVPCHRVVGADGSLTGYAGGTDKKRYLSELEKGFFNGKR